MRRSFADADIARDKIGLLEWHIEFGFVGKFEREHFLFTIGRRWNSRQAREPRDAVFEMDHEIVLVQFAEIDLSAVTFGMIQPPSRVRRKTAEQLGRRQNDQVGRRKTKAAR